MFKNLEMTSAPLVSRKQMQILAVIAVSVFVMGVGLLYVLQMKQKELDNAAAARQSKAGTNQEIAGRYTATLDGYNTTMEQLKYVEPSSSLDNYVPTLIQQLQQMSASDHVKLTGVRPSVLVDPSAKVGGPRTSTPDSGKTLLNYKILPVTLTLEGTYNQLLTYIFHMTRFPKILSVQTITLMPKTVMNADTPSLASPLLVATIGLNAYIFDPDTDGSEKTKDVTPAISVTDAALTAPTAPRGPANLSSTIAVSPQRTFNRTTDSKGGPDIGQPTSR